MYNVFSFLTTLASCYTSTYSKKKKNSCAFKLKKKKHYKKSQVFSFLDVQKILKTWIL